MNGIDGVDHINVYSRGETEIGYKLSNMYALHIEEWGQSFNSIEQAYQWLKFDMADMPIAANAVLKAANAYASKNTAKRFNNSQVFAVVTSDAFRNKIMQLIKERIDFDESIKEMYQANPLPLEHYYVHGDRKVNQMDKYSWMVKGIEDYLRS